MYEEDTASGCSFDPNNSSMPESAETVLNINSPLPPPPPPPPQQLGPETTHYNSLAHVEENLRLFMEELSYHHHHGQHHNNNNNNNNNLHQEDDTAMEIELQNELGFNLDHNSYNTCSDNNNNNTTHLVSYEQNPNWDIHGVVHECPEAHPPPTPDLLNLLHLSRRSPSSVLPNSSISFTNPNPKPVNFAIYDPLFHLNLPPQPPLLRELMLQSLPHGSLFSNGGDEREGSGVLEFSREMGSTRGGTGGKAKGTKHSTTGQDKRIQLNGKFTALRNLIPNPTKSDQASIVGDAIDYIKELRRTVDELKLVVEKKRCGRERSKRHKTEEGAGAGDNKDESSNMKPLGDPHDQDQSYNNGALGSSWLQRKSKDTEVDVRIIDDEVTIKLVQKKKINLLLFVSKLLDELQLDIHHVAGGHIGNSYSFLFNTKMYEGSCLYASAIASKFIEVLDRQSAAIPPPTSSY